MNFETIQSVWRDDTLVFYDVFRGLHGKVWALAPVAAVEWENERAPFASLKTKPQAMLSSPLRGGVLSDVFIDQRQSHLFYGSQILQPLIRHFHWHATLFEFDVSEGVEEIDLHYRFQGERCKTVIALPEPSAKRWFCADTTMFRDDTKILPEWLSHNRKLGFEHFFLYDNFSDPPPGDLGSDVTLLQWPFPYYYQLLEGQTDDTLYGRHGQGLGSQIPQEFHALYKHGPQCEWLGFFDTDEYLNLLQDDDIVKLLGDGWGEDDCDYDVAVMIGSLFFGSLREKGAKSIRRRYLHREPIADGAEAYSRRKPLVRVENVLAGEHVGIHDWVTARDPYDNLRRDSFVTELRWQVPLDRARLHHYWAVSYRRRDMDPSRIFHSEERDETILR